MPDLPPSWFSSEQTISFSVVHHSHFPSHPDVAANCHADELPPPQNIPWAVSFFNSHMPHRPPISLSKGVKVGVQRDMRHTSHKDAQAFTAHSAQPRGLINRLPAELWKEALPALIGQTCDGNLVSFLCRGEAEKRIQSSRKIQPRQCRDARWLGPPHRGELASLIPNGERPDALEKWDEKSAWNDEREGREENLK